jgi:hypothetical protein
MRILAVGDSYMPPRYFAEAFSELEAAHKVDYMQVDATRRFEPRSPWELKLREYQGSPAELVEYMPGVEALVVQEPRHRRGPRRLRGAATCRLRTRGPQSMSTWRR